MPEYKDYLTRAEEALSSAMILYEKEKYNSAVSEAYYSMYYSARALLSLKDFYPKKHKGLLRILGLEFVKKGYLEEAYARAFAKCMQLREKADYDVTYKVSKEEAKTAIEYAEKFLERIKKLIEEI